MRLSDSVAAAVADRDEPAALLAMRYAEQIDQASHVPATLAAALDTLRRAAHLADTEDPTNDAGRALDQIAAALASVTVLERLGPKLLATLDTLLLTPKAQKAITGGLTEAAQPTTPLSGLRDRHGTRHLRAAG